MNSIRARNAGRPPSPWAADSLEPLERRTLLAAPAPAADPAFDNVLYYPEGFAGSTITEFVPLGNPNDAPAQYRVIAHFEANLPDQVLAEGTLAANSRGGITISRANDHSADLVQQGLPYAIEVQSTEPLVASISHYDFGSATGETFTDTPATSWAFPQVANGPGRRDFIVWYNTAADQAAITIRFIAADGSTITTASTQTRAKARGGVDLSEIPGLPASGAFAAVITSDKPIVAAASRYFSLGGQHSASTELGTAGPGATTGIAPLGSLADGASEELAFLDLRQGSPQEGSPAPTVTLTFRSADAGIPPVQRTIALNEFGITRFDATTLSGDLNTSRYAVEYSSSIPLVARTLHHEHNEDAATSFAQSSAKRSTFADGFMDPQRAGQDVFETIGVSRLPGSTAASSVRVIARFTDGSSVSEDFSLNDNGVFALDLHEWQRLLDAIAASSLFFYTIEVDTTAAVAAAMWHYDMTLGADTPAGGFAAGSQPQDVVDPIPPPPPPGTAIYDFRTGFALGHNSSASPLGSVLTVPAGGTGRIDITLRGGVYSFDGNGRVFNNYPPGSPQIPASNQGVSDLRGDITLLGSGASLVMAAQPRIAPFVMGSVFDGVLSDDGRSITGFDAANNVLQNLTWRDGSPRPGPVAAGINSLTGVYRFSIILSDTTTPRDLTVTFDGAGSAMLGWLAFGENAPQDGADGNVQYIGFGDVPLRPLPTLTLTIRIG